MERFAAAWDKLAGRERLLVAALVLIFLPLALAFLVAQPMLEARADANRQKAEAASLYTWVTQRDAEWQSRAPNAQTSTKRAAPVGIAGIENALSNAGLREAVSRLENAQDGRIRLQLDGAPFADFARFLERVAPELGYSIGSLQITPGQTPGVVEARLELRP